MCPLGFREQMGTDWASSRLSPSQPSCLPSSPLSFPVSLSLRLPPFSLPALCFSSPSSRVFTIQVNEGPQNWLGLLVGTILFSWSIREKQAALWRSLNPLSPLSRLCSSSTPRFMSALSASLPVCFSLYLSLSLVTYVGPLSCRRWAPWALWRIACGEAERKRSCASSCPGTWLRELLSSTRISINMTWQVVLKLQGLRSLSIVPEVGRLETVYFWTGVWVKQRWWF